MEDLMGATAQEADTDLTGQGGEQSTEQTNDATQEFEPWKAQVSEDYRYHEALKGMKSPTEAVKRLIELSEKTSNLDSMVPAYDPEMSEEQFNSYAERVGLVSPDDVGEDFDGDVEILRKAGISKKQFAVLRDAAKAQQEQSSQQQEDQRLIAMKRARDKASQELRKEWGEEYNDNIAYMSRAVNDLFDKEFVTQIRQIGITNSPQFAKAMSRVGRLMSDHMIKQGKQSAKSAESGWDFE